MRTQRLLCVAITVVMACLPVAAAAQIQITTVATGLSSPVFVGNAGDGSGRLFIVEQAGVIKVLQPGNSPTVFLDIQSRVLAGGERGLLGLAFHPSYSANGRFFVFYTQKPDGALVVAEYLASPPGSNVAETTERPILEIPHPDAENHNGGMLAFGGDGYLYIGVGDGGSANDPPNNAQNLNTLLGKILRIDINAVPYAIPPDNPFAGAAIGLDEIFAYGFRNPWRFSVDRDTHELWVGDVGQGAREEVDTPILSGGNYGWRLWEGTLCREKRLCRGIDEIAPLFDYAHSGGRCSLTGGYVYRGNQGTVPQSTYIHGDYCSGEIFAWNGSSQSVLLDTGALISSFGEDEQGELYVVDLRGTVNRIAAAGCQISISPTTFTFPSAGGNETVNVMTGPGCGWTAESNAPSWMTVTGGATGTGSGSVTFAVAPYTGNPKSRTGTLTIAGQTVTVKQSK